LAALHRFQTGYLKATTPIEVVAEFLCRSGSIDDDPRVLHCGREFNPKGTGTALGPALELLIFKEKAGRDNLRKYCYVEQKRLNLTFRSQR
jgi:hypothetical protein